MNCNNLYYIQYSKGIEYLEKAIMFCDLGQRGILSKIIQVHRDEINKMQLQSLVVINPTKTELGTIRSAFKKIVRAYYLTPISKILKSKINAIDPDFICDELTDDEYSRMLDIYWAEKKEYLDSPYLKLKEELNKLCDKTEIPDFIISSKILLQRKTNNNYFTRNELENELNEHLNLLMLKEFQNKNEEFIKTNLNPKNYETSK